MNLCCFIIIKKLIHYYKEFKVLLSIWIRRQVACSSYKGGFAPLGVVFLFSEERNTWLLR